jgi:hypothetical protein
MVTLARRIGAVVGISAFVVLTTPALAHAALSISVPSSAPFGSVASGTTSISHQLGAVTVTASGLVAPSFTATVSTATFTTGAGGASETIPTTSISYWSGPATASTGLQNSTAGQVDANHAAILSTSVTAFGSVGLALNITTTWNPTIVIAIPAAAVAGLYSGTITHSVA